MVTVEVGRIVKSIVLLDLRVPVTARIKLWATLHEERDVFPVSIAGFKPKYKVLLGLLLLISGFDAILFYAAEAMSARDYSRIADPQLRVGYCMLSNLSIPEKYLLAESTAHPPDLKVLTVVMSHATGGEFTEQNVAAIRALRERDELRLRAIRSSFRVAITCGYQGINWPPEITPLVISTKWLQHDSTYAFFLEKVRSEPDEADRVYYELAGPKARPRGASF